MEIPVGYAQASLFFTGNGMPNGAAVTFGLNVGVDGESANTVASEVWDRWIADVLPKQTNTTQLVRVLVKFGPAETGQSGERNGTALGGVSTAGMTPNVAYLIKKITNAGGRAGRGRMFIPGVAESVVNEAGVVLASSVTDLTTQFQSFRTHLADDGHPMVLLHGTGAPISTPLLVTALQCDARVATQRRRLRR